MLRHYDKSRLKSKNKLFHYVSSPSVWNLPPYEVARFGGELSQIILTTVEQYIYEKSYARQKKIFENKIFEKKLSPSNEILIQE